MTRCLIKSVIVTLLLLSGVPLKGQPDSLALDSLTKRIKTILEVYNASNLYVDTSDYVQYDYSANDKNLLIAASRGACNEIIRLFVRGADVDNRAGGTAAPIHYAVSSGRWEAVEILLLLGADPDKPDFLGNPPLVVAVRASAPEIAEKLIRYGATLSKADKQNSTPLHHAAALGDFLMTDMLLYYDSPINMLDNEGNTPLMTGVCFGYPDVADLLIQSGADPNVPDIKGFSPLMAATLNGDTVMMNLLINAGADLYSLNSEGLDALGCAIVGGQDESAAYLLRKGNRWNQTRSTKSDPVALANDYGRKEILRMLLEYGMDGQRRLSFNELSISAAGLFTPHSLMAGGSVSVKDPGIRTGITIGAAANPVSQRMLVRGDEDKLCQYNVRSSLIYAGPFMEFRVNQPNSQLNVNLVPALYLGYRFHSLYEGTLERPDNSVVIMPSADIRISRRNIEAGAGISYLRLPFYKAGPFWVTLKASFTLTRSAASFTAKRVRLYNYEQN